jgi:hypothetical protein
MELFAYPNKNPPSPATAIVLKMSGLIHLPHIRRRADHKIDETSVRLDNRFLLILTSPHSPVDFQI